ncbi:MAG: protoporphyrinogen oxidase [Planctomycetota bacterium]
MDDAATGDVTDAIVVGAGLTGLACARELSKRGLRVMVLEAGREVGGVVGTFETNGFLFESGPNTVPASALNVREAAADLGIDGQLVTSRPEAKRRFLFIDGGLHALPSSPRSLVSTPILSARAKRRLFTEPFRRYRAPMDDVEPSFEDFLTERIGSEATRTLAGAFVRGVYAAEIEELGSESAFPRLVRMCREHGGLVRGMMARGRAAKRARRREEAQPPGPRTSATDLISFGGGFGTLTRAYGRALEGAVSTSTPLAELDRGPGGWRAILESGESLACRELVLAVPAPIAHPLVAMCAPERLDLDGLRDIDHAAVTAVHLGLEGATLPPGFGFLVPPDEEARRDPRTPRVLGVLFVSNIFSSRAPSGTSSITAMFRGGDVANLVGDALVDRAVVELEKALIGYRVVHPGAGPAPATRPRVVASQVQRWTNVIPRYGPGHADRMQKLASSASRMLPGLHLVGSYVGGVSVDDRIRVGRATGDVVHARLSRSGGRDPDAADGIRQAVRSGDEIPGGAR